LLLLAGSLTVGVVLTAALSLAIAFFISGAPNVPRSIPFIFLLLALVATAGPRLLVRLSARSTTTLRSNGRASHSAPRPVLIMGAGDAGAMIVRELKNNPHLGLEPVGFLDDDLGKHDVRIHGIPVLGDRQAIPEMIAALRVKLVIIAMPTASGKTIREIIAVCGKAGVETRIVPGLYELLDGAVSVQQLREVQIEDLLRRAPVQIDAAQVATLVHGKRVLVTGAGGSIGSELCRQIARLDPAELVLLGHGENSIFDIHNELKGLEVGRWKLESESRAGRSTIVEAGAHMISSLQPPTSVLHPIIADIREADRLHAVLEQYRPEVVFHAAAHKHVPLMESNEVEAVTNNVLGTRNLVRAAMQAGVTHFVLISTDKAVNPSSVMGTTKRLAELIVQQAARQSGQVFAAVRFGNVLNSRGSVIPFFRKQIAAGGPVTVTHPEMRRYFMTIPEAVQLVLQAAALGHGGEVFVLDMGEPVYIKDLACDLIRLSGLEPGHDIDVVFTGLRPGEKLSEELFSDREAYTRTQHQKVFVSQNGREREADQASCLDAGVDELIAAAQRGDADEVRRLLRTLVPEYRAETA
jgi:FlaA1/EpsC-like NDP-sugar epimerase